MISSEEIRKKLALKADAKPFHPKAFADIDMNTMQPAICVKKGNPIAQWKDPENPTNPETKKKKVNKIVPDDPSELRVFVKNLRPETTEKTLTAYFR